MGVINPSRPIIKRYPRDACRPVGHLKPKKKKIVWIDDYTFCDMEDGIVWRLINGQWTVVEWID